MTDFFSTNTFDLAVYACLFVAVVMGFMAGLLRSLATIIGYICGAGIAVAATPKALSLLANYPKIPTPQTWIVVVAIFIVTGALISVVLRLIVSGVAGRNVSVPDRIGSAALGAFRVAMLAIMLVLVFDRIVPQGHFAHDKFVVVCDANRKPLRVLTGSTNWTFTGLCTQANNGLISGLSAGWIARFESHAPTASRRR
jgi:membrane protein required for colicin V production